MNPINRAIFWFVGQIVDYVFLFLVGVVVLIGAFFILAVVTPAHSREFVIASVYGDHRDATPDKKLQALRSRVATGARFDPNSMTAAHRSLPFGTTLTLSFGRRTAVVVIRDRGPFIRGRALDLTPAAKKALRCSDLCRVEVRPWPPLPKPRPAIPNAIAWGVEGHE